VSHVGPRLRGLERGVAAIRFGNRKFSFSRRHICIRTGLGRGHSSTSKVMCLLLLFKLKQRKIGTL
jgi:hypothetical protein